MNLGWFYFCFRVNMIVYVQQVAFPLLGPSALLMFARARLPDHQLKTSSSTQSLVLSNKKRSKMKYFSLSLCLSLSLPRSLSLGSLRGLLLCYHFSQNKKSLCVKLYGTVTCNMRVSFKNNINVLASWLIEMNNGYVSP